MPQLFHHTANYIRTAVCFLYAKIVRENFRRSISQKLEPIRKKLSAYLGSATSICPKIDLTFSAKIFLLTSIMNTVLSRVLVIVMQ